MLHTQLQEVFKNIFDKFNEHDLDHEITLKDDKNIVLSNALPLALKEHLTEKEILLTRIDNDADYQANTEMLQRRLRSVFKACNSLKINAAKLASLEKEAKDYINNKFNIDALRKEFNSKKKELPLDKLKTLLKKYEEYVQKIVFVELARLHASDENIEFKDPAYLEFLHQLRKAEIERPKSRRTFVNYNWETNYFTAEIPLGMDANNKPYMQHSYKRNSPLLSNYVLHIMGHRDRATNSITILNHSTRAANYVPISLENDGEILQGTIAQVKQRHDSEIALHTAGKEPKVHTQISLLTPLSQTVAEIDEQQGYKQTLFTYLAFLMQNQSNPKGMEMRYCVQGVNKMRKKGLSDPLKAHINTRFYNQLFSDIFNKIKPLAEKNRDQIGNTYLYALNNALTPIRNEITIKNENVRTLWKKVEITVKNINTFIQQTGQQETVNSTELNSLIDKFKNALKDHHNEEVDFNKEILKSWKNHEAIIIQHLDELKEQIRILNSQNEPVKEELLQSYNLIQELNNLIFLLEDKKYRLREYNYQLPVTVHHLSANLNYEVGVNCNDSEDRTGLENIVVMGWIEFMRKRNNLAPDLKDKTVLKEIQLLVRKHQAKDAGINNTAANGVAGQQVDTNDVAPGLVNAEAVEMAKLTKNIYEPILHADNWWSRLKSLKFVEKFKIAANFLKQKISRRPFTNNNVKIKPMESKRLSNSPVLVPINLQPSNGADQKQASSAPQQDNHTNSKLRNTTKVGLSGAAAILLAISLAPANPTSNPDNSIDSTQIIQSGTHDSKDSLTSSNSVTVKEDIDNLGNKEEQIGEKDFSGSSSSITPINDGNAFIENKKGDNRPGRPDVNSTVLDNSGRQSRKNTSPMDENRLSLINTRSTFFPSSATLKEKYFSKPQQHRFHSTNEPNSSLTTDITSYQNGPGFD